MKKALQISQQLTDEQIRKAKEEEDEEMKMIQQAIELSRLEEEERLRKEKEIEVSEVEKAEAERLAKEEAA